jgi:hypothetical protein
LNCKPGEKFAQDSHIRQEKSLHPQSQEDFWPENRCDYGPFAQQRRRMPKSNSVKKIGDS